LTHATAWLNFEGIILSEISQSPKEQILQDFIYMRSLVTLFFFFSTGAWTQHLHLEPLHQPYFCEGFFETGSHKLFAQAGFKPQSSWSLPPE
jgi:hypothetical protein